MRKAKKLFQIIRTYKRKAGNAWRVEVRQYIPFRYEIILIDRKGGEKFVYQDEMGISLKPPIPLHVDSWVEQAYADICVLMALEGK